MREKKRRKEEKSEEQRRDENVKTFNILSNNQDKIREEHMQYKRRESERSAEKRKYNQSREEHIMQKIASI